MTGTIPSTVPHRQVIEALEPLLTLLGTNAMELYYTRGLQIADGRITFTMAAGLARGDTPGRIVTVGDDPATQEYAIEVSIPMVD